MTTKLTWWEERYVQVTAKLGDVVRQLSFAGVGSIWVVGGVDATNPRLPFLLGLSALLFVASLAADLAQGTLTAIDTRLVTNRIRRGDTAFLDVDSQPLWVRLVANSLDWLLWARVALTAAGYLPLILYAWRSIGLS